MSFKHNRGNGQFMGAKISDQEFVKIRNLVYEKAGINLHEGKKSLVQARLGKIIRREGFSGFDDYYGQILNDDTGNRLVELLDTISTNHTYFFREDDHLTWLSETILPDILTLKSVKGEGEIRIWSAGCSTGEEPYTLAMQILENDVLSPQMRVKMLATDLSTRVIETAKTGLYKPEKVKTVPGPILKKYFHKKRGGNENLYQVSQRVRDLITFHVLNLLSPFPFQRQFALIFCRNVMIYFDKPTQNRVVNKFYEVLKPGGYFIVGHSESLSSVKHNFQYVAPTIYRKDG